MIGESQLDDMARLWFYEPMGMEHTCFCPQGENIAPTNINRDSGVVTVGIVNDYNSRALGGITGNAGLFSNLHDCSVFARMLLCNGYHNGQRILSSAMLHAARKNYTLGVPTYRNMNFNNARGLGLYMACESENPVAEILSPLTFGHTGHTGTSIIIDPENEIYVVLLTSRLHVLGQPTDEIWRIRRLVHNAIAANI
jgi:CubicO group peptidase (beta-lactamase class C family)